MFVASYARLPPGSRFHLSVNVQIFPCNAKNMGFCGYNPYFTARPFYYNARYRLGTTRALHYNARHRLGTARALHYNARCRLGHSITMRGTASYYNARYRLGTARALYYNARPHLGTARALYYNARYEAVPLGPSITMRGTDAPFAFYKF